MRVGDIQKEPIHLGLGAKAEIQPSFTGTMDWYEGYGKRTGSDGAEGRLVAQHTFRESWTGWEMHPNGAEVVLCTAGSMTFHLQGADGTVTGVPLAAGQYVIVPPGTWHTADVEAEATALFITAGMGTRHRPRA